MKVFGKFPLRYLLLCLVFLALPLFASASGGSSGRVAVLGDDGVQKIEMLAGSYFYKPDHIIVRVNVPVELSVRKKRGLIPHTIEIHEQGAGLDIKESLGTKLTVIRFTPRKTGSYEYYCAKRFLFFKSHRKKGMKGIIEVVE